MPIPASCKLAVRSDVMKFQWRIENFRWIRQNKKLLEAQQITVTLGAPVGSQCKWTFSLNSEMETITPPTQLPLVTGVLNDTNGITAGGTVHWLEIIRKLVQVPRDGYDITEVCTYKIRNKDEKICSIGYGYVRNTKLNERRAFKKVLRMTDKSSELPLIKEALVIDFKVTTSATKELSIESTAAVSDFNRKSSEKMTTDLTKLITVNFESSFSDIKIIAKDGEAFRALRSILAARNPVFEAMFASNLSENQSGIIRVDDLGGNALEILLKYIYGGALNEEWFKPGILVELTYAAGKYLLTEVLQFLDNELGTRGQGEDAGSLLALCEKLSLKKAEIELTSYIKNDVALSTTSFADLSELFGNSVGG